MTYNVFGGTLNPTLLLSSAFPLLTLPTTHTNFGRRTFTYSAPDVWNNLPPDVLHCNTLNTFIKKHLKTHLFTSSLKLPDLSPSASEALHYGAI